MGFLGIIFQTQRWLTRPDLSSKFMTRTHHYRAKTKAAYLPRAYF